MLPREGDRSWPDGWPESWRDAADAGECLHCGNDLGGFWKPEDGPFCCRGCRGVWEMINRSDLCRYYDLKSGANAPAPALAPESFDWLDRLLAEREGDDGPLRLNLDIQGVHCAACVWLIEQVFNRHDAGIQIRINSALGKVELSWDAARGDLKAFLAEVEAFGYRLAPASREIPRHSRALLMRMAISIAMALNVMMFSLSYYFGLAPEDGRLYMFFGWLSLALSTVSMAAGGGVFFTAAVAGLRRRMLHLDLPISVGMLLAYGGSVFGFLTGGPEEAYFDSLTVFIALMLIGRWAREHIIERNRNALLAATGAENLTVKRQTGGGLTVIPAQEIELNDELWIAPGDLVPVEGVLMRRGVEAAMDWITGESERRAFEPGDRVPAGAFNAGEHGFAITAVERLADSRLLDLLRVTADAEDWRPPWWHRISGGYVVAVLTLAAAGFAGWMFVDPALALKVAISVLVVTCPCALGLATPLAEELIHVALRRAGIFLRRSDFLEKALQVRKILLDKTGTVTLGHLALDDPSAAVLDGLPARETEVLRQMTARSNHPVSRCLQSALRGATVLAPDEAVGSLEGEALSELAGRGLEIRLPDGVWRLGRAGWALAEGEAPRSDDRTTVLTLDGAPRASFRLVEAFKADAAAEVATLRRRGYDVHLVSGDAQAKVDLAAKAIGIPGDRALGGLSPEDKAARVAELDDRDTLMVGDGLNDSPSFAAAFCAATPAVDRPVLPGKADFYFLGDGIAAIRRSLQAAQRLRRIVRDNLAFAVTYNVLAAGLCLAALVTPVVAAILMPVSSIFIVSWTALRLARGEARWMS